MIIFFPFTLYSQHRRRNVGPKNGCIGRLPSGFQDRFAHSSPDLTRLEKQPLVVVGRELNSRSPHPATVRWPQLPQSLEDVVPMITLAVGLTEPVEHSSVVLSLFVEAFGEGICPVATQCASEISYTFRLVLACGIRAADSQASRYCDVG